MHNSKLILIALLLTGCKLIASQNGPSVAADVEKMSPGLKTEMAAPSSNPISTLSQTMDPKTNPKPTPDINTTLISTPNAPDAPINKPANTDEIPLSTSTSGAVEIPTSTSASSTTASSKPDDASTPKPDAPPSKPDAPTSKPDITTPKVDTTTPKEDITTPKADTTTRKADTTTPKADTTTPKADTTTPKADTTSSKPDTTTPASTTTSTPAPSTTTSKPTPYPQPSIGQWNSSCIMVKMAAQLNITYLTNDMKNASVLYNIPPKATVKDGICQAVTQQIQISWGTDEAEHSMLLQFDLKSKTSELTMLRFIIAIVGDDFPNALENQTISMLHRGKDFSAPLEMSYHCTRSQRFNLTETVAETTMVGSVTMRDVQVEAFRKANSSSNFSAVHDCDGADTPDIVPIAVGIALVAMIMIILISYLCARRRSNLRGYMSF